MKVVLTILLLSLSGLAQTSHTLVSADATGTVYAVMQPGADACAKINAACALLPQGGIVDARGFSTDQTCTTTINCGAKPVSLFFNWAAKWTRSGNGDFLLLGEGSDHSQVHDLKLDMNNTVGCGIHMQGTWSSDLYRVKVKRAGTAGLCITDDGATSRGTYDINIYASRFEEGNKLGALLKSTTAGGVTTTNFWGSSSTANGAGFRLQADSLPSIVMGTNFYGGYSQLHVKTINGVTTSGVGLELVGYVISTNNSLDIEANAGWGITNDTHVSGLNLTGPMDNNTDGYFQKNAKFIGWSFANYKPGYAPGDVNNPFTYEGEFPLAIQNRTGNASLSLYSKQQTTWFSAEDSSVANYLWSISQRSVDPLTGLANPDDYARVLAYDADGLLQFLRPFYASGTADIVGAATFESTIGVVGMANLNGGTSTPKLDGITDTSTVANLNADLLDGNHAAAFALAPVTAPTHNTDACTAGTWAHDTGYFYFCHASGDWRRIAWTAGSW